MTKRILQFIFLPILLLIIYVTNISYSTGPPNTAVTDGCTCHGPTPNANTVVTTNFNSGNMAYVNGQTYPIEISVMSGTNQVGAGFAMSVNIGTLSLNSSGVQISGLIAKHSTPKATSGSNPSVATWIVNWTAPASGNTNLIINAAGNAVNLANGNVGDQWNFASPTSIPLPIPMPLAKINVSKYFNDTKIEWSIQQNTEIETFEVESSSDGLNFSTITSINALISQDKNNYTYLDTKKYTSSEIFYRIVGVGFDGKKTYSEKVLIKNEINEGVFIYPTAISSNKNLNIHISKKLIGSDLLVFSTIGQLVLRYTLTQETNQIALPTMVKGYYLTCVRNNQGVVQIGKILIN